MAFKISFTKDFRARNYKSLLAQFSVKDDSTGMEIRDINVSKSKNNDTVFYNLPGDRWNEVSRQMEHSICGPQRSQIIEAVKSAYEALNTKTAA